MELLRKELDTVVVLIGGRLCVCVCVCVCVCTCPLISRHGEMRVVFGTEA